MVQFKLRQFLTNLGTAVSGLFRACHDPRVREHPVWGGAIPYLIPNLGSGMSSHYCVRPDIVPVLNGDDVAAKVVELNLFPAGRGIITRMLNEEQRVEFLKAFAAWYLEMSGPLSYAIATDSYWPKEIRLFCNELERLTGVKVQPVNIDDTPQISGTVDRMFQLYQCKSLHSWNAQFFPCESWIDSKAILALVHDESMTTVLLDYLSRESLTLLREAIPETRLVTDSFIDDHFARSRGEWLLKNADGDSPTTFGGRGIRKGKDLSSAKLHLLVRGADDRLLEGLGRVTIAQRAVQSMECRRFWELAVEERTFCDTTEFGFPPLKLPPTREGTYGCIRPFLLLSQQTGTARVPPYCATTLRQSQIVHGGRDSLDLPVQLV